MRDVSVYLERAVVSLQFTAQALQLASGQDGLAVLVPQVVLFLDQLGLLLLKSSHLLLRVAVLFELNKTMRRFKKGNLVFMLLANHYTERRQHYCMYYM